MLLLNPPLCKPAEPPAALAALAAALRAEGHPCTVCDLSIEALHHLFATTAPDGETWSKRAFRNLADNLASLRSPSLYASPGRYRRAVADIDRVVAVAGRRHQLRLSLGNYLDPALSPLKSSHLRRAATTCRQNIFFPFFQRRLDQLLADTATPFVGLSLNYLSQALTTFAIIGYLRQHHPERRIVLGGGLVTTWLSGCRSDQLFAGDTGLAGLADLVDHWVSGRGEEPLLALLADGGDSSGGGRVRHLTPDYSDLRDNDYLSPGFILPYAASTGCFWRRCTFCPEKSENNPYLPVPPAKVVADLIALVATHQPRLIHLLDNAISPATLRALAVEPPGAPWYGFARIDAALADLEFCHRLRKAGCQMLKLGLESGDQGVLDRLDKGIDLQLAGQVLDNLAAAGISSYLYLLFGTPAETAAAAARTLDFVVEREAVIGYLNLAIFNLPANSPEAAELATSAFYAGDLAIYREFHHPQGWQRDQVRRYLDKSFKRQPAVAAILARDPPIFTSNHAPLFSRPVAKRK